MVEDIIVKKCKTCGNEIRTFDDRIEYCNNCYSDSEEIMLEQAREEDYARKENER